jgi:hypothetical protein
VRLHIQTYAPPVLYPAMVQVGSLMYYLNKPMMTTGAVSVEFYAYTTVSRMLMPVNRFSKAVSKHR